MLKEIPLREWSEAKCNKRRPLTVTHQLLYQAADNNEKKYSIPVGNLNLNLKFWFLNLESEKLIIFARFLSPNYVFIIQIL